MAEKKPVLNFGVWNYGKEVLFDCHKCGKVLIRGQHGITLRVRLPGAEPEYKNFCGKEVDCECGAKVSVLVLFATHDEAMEYALEQRNEMMLRHNVDMN